MAEIESPKEQKPDNLTQYIKKQKFEQAKIVNPYVIELNDGKYLIQVVGCVQEININPNKTFSLKKTKYPSWRKETMFEKDMRELTNNQTSIRIQDLTADSISIKGIQLSNNKVNISNVEIRKGAEIDGKISIPVPGANMDIKINNDKLGFEINSYLK